MSTEFIVTAWGGQSSQKNLGDGWPSHLRPFAALSIKGADGATVYDVADTPRLAEGAGCPLELWQWVRALSTKAAVAEADALAEAVWREVRAGRLVRRVYPNPEHDAVYGRRRKSGPLKGKRRRPAEPWELRICTYLDRLREQLPPDVEIWWNGLSGRSVATKAILSRCDGIIAMCYGSIGRQVPKRLRQLRKRAPGKPVGAMIHSGRLKTRWLDTLLGRVVVRGRGPEDWLEATLERIVERDKPDAILFWVGGGSVVTGRVGVRHRKLGRLGHRNHRLGGGPQRLGNPSLAEIARRLARRGRLAA